MFNKFLKNKNKGYSLVEVLIYLSIFTIISAVVINSFIVVLSSFSRTQAERNLLEAGLTSMERISREIRQADNVDVVNSFFDYSPCILQLNSTNNDGSNKVVRIEVDSSGSNYLKISEGPNAGSLVSQGNLTRENISVQNLLFKRISNIKGESVKIEMVIVDSQSGKTTTFYNTVVLRGSY